MIRNRLKRMVVSGMIAVAIFALVGCSGAATGQKTNDESTVDEETITDNGIANTDRIEEKNAGTSP